MDMTFENKEDISELSREIHYLVDNQDISFPKTKEFLKELDKKID